MSNCIVTFIINGEEKELLVESSPSSVVDESIIEAIKNNPDIKRDIINEVKKQLNDTSIKSIKISDINKKGILANCNLNYLRHLPGNEEYDFPDGNANILLIDNLKLEGVPINKRVIKDNGEEVYIVRNTKDDLYRLSNYLKIKNTIEQDGQISEDSKEYKELKEIANAKNIATVEDLILDYISNKKEYSGIILKNGKSAIQILESFIRNLRNYNTPIEFDTPVVTAINYAKWYMGDGQAWISYDNLYNILKGYYPQVFQNLTIGNKKSETAFKVDEFVNQLVNSDIITKDIANSVFKNTSNSFDALVKFLNYLEPDFDYSYLRKTDKGIIIKQQHTPINNKYGISFDTIKDMKKTSYLDYNIYQYNNSYFVSRGTLTINNKSRKFSSEEEAKKYIKNSIQKQSLVKNSLIEFKFREFYTKDNKKVAIKYIKPEIKSETSFIPGQIIESINIPVDKNTNIKVDEQALLNLTKYTILDFYKVVDNYNVSEVTKKYLKKVLNTPEKVVTFIYKVNELFGDARNDDKKLIDLAKTIKYADKNYYYIESIENKSTYRIIPIERDDVTISQKDNTKPIRIYMDAISRVLQKQFGVTIHLETSSSIKENFKNIADPNIDKAFIYNGEVYVNTTIASTKDLLHEHVHLILGILKSNPELRRNYESLLRLVVSTIDGQKELVKVSELYPQLSEMDKEEEVFANLFSDYVRSHTGKEATKVFTSQDKELKKLTRTIFNTNISDIKAFYSERLTDIFSKFNKEVAKCLESSIDFGSTQQSRKISNWINKQIKNGNLIESC